MKETSCLSEESEKSVIICGVFPIVEFNNRNLEMVSQ